MRNTVRIIRILTGSGLLFFGIVTVALPMFAATPLNYGSNPIYWQLVLFPLVLVATGCWLVRPEVNAAIRRTPWLDRACTWQGKWRRSSR